MIDDPEWEAGWEAGCAGYEPPKKFTQVWWDGYITGCAHRRRYPQFAALNKPKEAK